MKKIGVLSSLETYGGVQTCVISLIRGLNNIGIVPDLITDTVVNPKIVYEFKLKLNYIPISYSISKKNYKKLWWLRGFIELLYYYKTSKLQKKYDFLYIFTPQVIVNTDTPHLYYLSMSPNGIGITDNLFLPRIKLFFYKYFTRFFAPVFEIHKSIDNYVINSEFTAKLFFKNYGEKIRIIYPSNLISNDLVINYSNKNIVLFLSRLDSGKRPELIIDLAEDNPNLDFVIIGALENPNYLLVLKQKISEKSLKNIQIHANPDFKTVTRYLELAKFYVFPAVKEHFGITTVEAMMYGAIPFVHNSGGQTEIVPWDNLRFDNDNMLTKFKGIISLDENALNVLRLEIAIHVNKFKEDVFISKMIEYINS